MKSLDELIANILAAASAQRGAQFSNELRDAINAIDDSSDFRDARLRIAPRLAGLDSAMGAGFLAVWLGGGVEGGLDPEPTTLPILDAMLKWTRTIRTDPEGINKEEPDADTILGLERLGQGLVAHLARAPAQRVQLAAREQVIAELERVEHISAGPLWVLELLRKRSGTLWVIHVEGRKGVRVVYENISNCFHLFTLLQGALAGKMPGAKRASQQVLAVARGEVAGTAGDSAWWHYGVGPCPKADLAGSVWGEANPDSIPKIDGQQVVLLWPMVLSSRSWDAEFFGPFLMASPPSVTVTEELTTSQIDEWWARLGLPTIPQKPWWKLW